MIRNTFRLALRNVLKHKGFAFLNIASLAVGLTTSLLILLWIRDELSFEKFNMNSENIYRVEEDQFYSGERYHVTVTPHPSGPVWKEKIPEIREQTRIFRVFAGIAAGAIIVALITVTFQAIKASLSNPTEALKVE